MEAAIWFLVVERILSVRFWAKLVCSCIASGFVVKFPILWYRVGSRLRQNFTDKLSNWSHSIFLALVSLHPLHAAL